MADAAASGITRRQFLAGGAAGIAVAWAGPNMVWPTWADAVDAGPASAAQPAAATTGLSFADDFDQEFSGLLLSKWSVVRPVQLAGTTQFGASCPANSGFDSTQFLMGRGMVVAMNGVLGAGTGPGRIETVEALPLAAGGYTLSFQVAGSHHGADPWPGTLTASVPGCDAALTVTQAASDDFVPYTLQFVVSQDTLSTIVFESGDAPGQAGLVLDGIALVAA